MAESELQRALLHLYANIERFGPYARELFNSFTLSPAELQVLDELMTSQRDGLLLHAQLLRDKRRRLLIDALPASAVLAEARLVSLLETFHVGEGVGELAATLLAFADHARGAAVTKDGELVRFEALFASIALRTHADPVVVRCSYDAYAAMSSQSWPEHMTPCCYYLFRGDSVRVLTVSSRLADLLDLLRQGLPRADVLETLATEHERAMATASIERLVSVGAPIG